MLNLFQLPNRMPYHTVMLNLFQHPNRVPYHTVMLNLFQHPKPCAMPHRHAELVSASHSILP